MAAPAARQAGQGRAAARARAASGAGAGGGGQAGGAARARAGDRPEAAARVPAAGRPEAAARAPAAGNAGGGGAGGALRPAATPRAPRRCLQHHQRTGDGPLRDDGNVGGHRADRGGRTGQQRDIQLRRPRSTGRCRTPREHRRRFQTRRETFVVSNVTSSSFTLHQFQASGTRRAARKEQWPSRGQRRPTPRPVRLPPTAATTAGAPVSPPRARASRSSNPRTAGR